MANHFRLQLCREKWAGDKAFRVSVSVKMPMANRQTQTTPVLESGIATSLINRGARRNRVAQLRICEQKSPAKAELIKQKVLHGGFEPSTLGLEVPCSIQLS